MKKNIKTLSLLLGLCVVICIKGCDDKQSPNAKYVGDLEVTDINTTQNPKLSWRLDRYVVNNNNISGMAFSFHCNLKDTDICPGDYKGAGISIGVQIDEHSNRNSNGADLWPTNGHIVFDPDDGSGSLEHNGQLIHFGRSDDNGDSVIHFILGDPGIMDDEFNPAEGMILPNEDIYTYIEGKIGVWRGKKVIGIHRFQCYWNKSKNQQFFSTETTKGVLDQCGCGSFKIGNKMINSYDIFENIIMNVSEDNFITDPNEIIFQKYPPKKSPRNDIKNYNILDNGNGTNINWKFDSGITVNSINLSKLKWTENNGTWEWCYVPMKKDEAPCVIYDSGMIVLTDPNDPNSSINEKTEILSYTSPYTYLTTITLPEGTEFLGEEHFITPLISSNDQYSYEIPDSKTQIKMPMIKKSTDNRTLTYSGLFALSNDPDFQGYHPDKWGNDIYVIYVPVEGSVRLSWPKNSDFNGDGITNLTDFGQLNSEYGKFILDPDDPANPVFKCPYSTTTDVGIYELNEMANNWLYQKGK